MNQHETTPLHNDRAHNDRVHDDRVHDDQVLDDQDDATLRSHFKDAASFIDALSIPTMRRARPRRKRVIALTLVGIAAVGTTGGVQLAKSGQKKDSVLTKVLSEQALPKLILDSPDFEVSSFSEKTALDNQTQVEVLHVRNEKRNWFDIRAIPLTPDQAGPPVTVGTPIKIGAFDAFLDQQADNWTVQWKTHESDIFAFGTGQITPEIRAAVQTVEKLPNQPLTITKPPSAFVAHRIDEEQTNDYYLSYFGRSDGAHSNASVSLSANSPQPFFEDYYQSTNVVVRKGRKISVYKNRPSENWANIAWIDESGALVSLGATLKSDELLTLADTVRTATDLEWKKVLKKKQPQLGEPYLDVLESGTIGEGDSAIDWEFSAPPSKDNSCWKFQFSTNDQEKEACIAKADTDALQLVTATKVGTKPFIYGLTNDKTSNDSYVVRIINSDGESFVEDLTTDQPSVNKRSFAFPLPDDFSGPLTIELYPFDRQWYVETFGQHDTDAYLQDHVEPVFTKTINFE